MSGDFSTEGEPQIGFLERFQSLANLARRHFHSGRGGRAKLAISTSLISRIVTMAVSFLVLPISVRYLGNEGYGLMATITSVVGWLQFTNLGIGLGLQNALTEETATGNSQKQKELVSTAVLSLAGIGLFLLVAGLVVFPHIHWTAVFPPTTERFKAEIPRTVLVVFFGFVSTVVLGFVGPIYAARQELHIGGIQAMVTSLVILLGTFVAVHFRWGLLGLTICTIGATAVMQWSFALWTLYGRGIEELHPQWSSITRSAAARVYKNGISFFLLQLCNIAFFQIDAFLIVRFLTVDQVTPYSVAQKVFLQTGALFAIVTGSLWAAYGNAKAQGDFDWIRRTHGKMVRIFLMFFGLLATFMVLVGNRLLALWVGPAAAPGTLLITGVAFYFCAREWTALHAMLLNGLNVIRPQVWNLVLTALLTLGLDLFLVTRLGPLGLAVGGFIAFAVSGAWVLALPDIESDSSPSCRCEREMSTTARKTWLRLLRTAGVKHFRATSGLGLPYICHVGDESGETPYYNRQSSVPELAVMSAWCEAINRPVVFDIGANNGFIATQLAQLLRNKNPCIYAFEPVPSTFAHLKFSVDSLGLAEVVFPICRAASDSSGEVKVFYNPRQSLFAQIRDDELNPRVGGQSVLVQTITVDEAIVSLGITPTLLKVDVEGFESRVFEGASRLLNGDTPPAICFEWNPLTLSEANRSPAEITRSLANYRLYYVDDFEGQRRSFAQEIHDLGQVDWVCNVFALPPDRHEKWDVVRSRAIATLERL